MDRPIDRRIAVLADCFPALPSGTPTTRFRHFGAQGDATADPTAVAASACSCGASHTAAPGDTAPEDAGMGQPAAADIAAGFQAVLAAIDGIRAQLDSIDGNAAMAALPAEAARRAAIDEQLADVDARIASLVITIGDAPMFRRDDIVTLPDGSTGWVRSEDPMLMFGSTDRCVQVCMDIAATYDIEEDCTVLVPESQLTATGQVRDRDYIDGETSIVITETAPPKTEPVPVAA